MEIIPHFDDLDKEKDIKAYEGIKNIPSITVLSEFKVMQALMAHLSIITGNIVRLPLQLLKYKSTPEFKNSFALLASIIIAFLGIYFAGLDFDSGLELMKTQTIYKLWAVYTLFQIVIKFLMKVHSYTNKMIRGAIRENKSMIIPILVHSLSNALIFGCYSIYNGCYLAGLYGKKNIMFSASVHIQAIVMKKFFPKIAENNIASESILRLVMIFSIADHLRVGTVGEVKEIIIYQYICCFARFFLTSISEDADKLRKLYDEGLKDIFAQLNGAKVREELSIMQTFPSEAFTLTVLFLIVQGPFVNSVVTALITVALAFIGPVFIKLNAPKQEKKDEKKEENNEKKDKEKKDEKEQVVEKKKEKTE
ncbi:hypothetical protein GPJ56_002805 [Histomonas meleagridis]|uniref:uncharacterized protein n=1 Tax=Histomonas meleagridis TaxID=135588 RepID=UPI00355973A3|nr:hypothetical protein GPJ56_002805 [Histomonas meleagridis]KAH0806321.1 hypothetical protein GO595_001009 [Histomonas meleagridis]